MDIPLYILLILYGIGIIIFCVSTAFNMYHIIKFGMFDFTGKMNTAVFITFSIIIIAVTVLLLKDIAWTDTINIFNIFTLDSFQNSSDLEF